MSGLNQRSIHVWLLPAFLITLAIKLVLAASIPFSGDGVPWGWFIPAAFVQTAILIIYFRLLGWVAWRCRESFADDEEAGAT